MNVVEAVFCSVMGDKASMKLVPEGNCHDYWAKLHDTIKVLSLGVGNIM